MVNNFLCREVFCPSSGKSLVWQLGEQSKKFKKTRSHAKIAALFQTIICATRNMWKALSHSVTFTTATTTYNLPPQYKAKRKSLTQYIDCCLQWFATSRVNCDIFQKCFYSERFLDTLNAVIIKIHGNFCAQLFLSSFTNSVLAFPFNELLASNYRGPFLFPVVVKHNRQETSNTKVGARTPLTRDVFLCRWRLYLENFHWFRTESLFLDSRRSFLKKKHSKLTFWAVSSTLVRFSNSLQKFWNCWKKIQNSMRNYIC